MAGDEAESSVGPLERAGRSARKRVFAQWWSTPLVALAATGRNEDRPGRCMRQFAILCRFASRAAQRVCDSRSRVHTISRGAALLSNMDCDGCTV